MIFLIDLIYNSITYSPTMPPWLISELLINTNLYATLISLPVLRVPNIAVGGFIPKSVIFKSTLP